MLEQILDLCSNNIFFDEGAERSQFTSSPFHIISSYIISGDLDSKVKKSMKSYTMDVTWECIGILLFYCHLTTTEPQFVRLGRSLIDISQKVANSDVTDASIISERILMETIIFVVADCKIDLLQHVCNVSRQVDPLIQLIVVVAGTISASGQLNLKSILSTLFNIKETNSFTDLSVVRINAKSVQSATKTLRIMRQVLFSTETSSTNTKSHHPPLKNICPKEVENDKLTSSTRKTQKEIDLIMQRTNFEEVVFPISKTVPDNIMTNRHATSDFLKLFIKYKICSQRHFLYMLDNDAKLTLYRSGLPYGNK